MEMGDYLGVWIFGGECDLTEWCCLRGGGGGEPEVGDLEEAVFNREKGVL